MKKAEKRRTANDGDGTAVSDDCAGLTNLLSVSPAVLYEVSVSGQVLRVTWISDNITNTLGYSVRECLENPRWWQENLHPEDAIANVECGADFLERSHHLHEYRFRHKNGTYRWMRDELRVLRDEAGEPTRIVGSWSDITALKDTENDLQEAYHDLERRVDERTRELQESEARFRDYAEAASDWFWEMDENLRFKALSSKYSSSMAFSEEKVIGKTRFDFSQYDYDENKEKWERHRDDLENHRPFEDFRYKLLTEKGEEATLSVSGKPIFGQDGEFLGYRGTGRNVTDLIIAEGELKKAHDELEQRVNERTESLEKAQEALNRTNRVLKALSECGAALTQSKTEQDLLFEICRVVVETGGYILAWVGYAEDDAEKTVRPVVSFGNDDGYVERVNATWADTERGRGPVGKAIRNKKPAAMQDGFKDENYRPWREAAIKRGFASTGAFPLMENGRPFGSLSLYAGEPDAFDEDEVKLLTDLTNNLAYGILALRQAEERELTAKALLDAKQEAEQANLAKSKFLAAASHDLRQPLQALNLFVSVLSRGNLDRESRKITNRIDGSVKALEGLLDALLDISKLEAGIVIPETSAVRMRDLCEILGNEFRDQAKSKGLRFRAFAPNTAVISDPILLETILRNLLSNAIRYTSTGGVLVGCRRRGPTLRIEVWDTGPGIPENQLKPIFQEFYQAGEPDDGMGLGLAIVDRLAKLLGHTVRVSSRLGKGSVFTIEVPLVLGSVQKTETDSQPLLKVYRKALIVVIDDKADILKGMEMQIKAWGYSVLTARSGRKALDALKEQGRIPDLIIADYRLRRRGETGSDAIREIQNQINADIPGFLITGDTGSERLRQAKESGFQLLHKPVSPQKLRQTINEMLRFSHGANRKRLQNR